MYTQYWDLQRLPFENAPDSDFFYESEAHQEAAARIGFAVETHKAIALLTGDYGSGKTLVCRTTISRLDPNKFKAAFVSNPRMDALDLTREIAYQLGEDIPTRSKYDVLHAFNNLLDRHHSAGRHCVAFLDEAQLVSDVSVLEELRLLLNYDAKGHFLLTLVLVGQTELREVLHPIPQMTQRISLSFHIPHLAAEEVGSYITHRLRTAGGTKDIFEADAIERIAQATKGNPREINAICDMCMLTASLSGQDMIKVDNVVDAAGERA